MTVSGTRLQAGRHLLVDISRDRWSTRASHGSYGVTPVAIRCCTCWSSFHFDYFLFLFSGLLLLLPLAIRIYSLLFDN